MMYDDRTPSYTWRDSFCMPLESRWSRITKFSVLNGMAVSSVMSIRGLLKELCYDPTPPYHLGLPPLNTSNPPQRGMKYSVRKMKICPYCIKNGYHSYMHDIDGIDICFLHEIPLIHITRDQIKLSLRGSYGFIDVKTCDIIQNNELVALLQDYLNRMSSNPVLNISNSFHRYADDIERCYISTEQIYRKHYLLQSGIELFGCTCIKSIGIDQIDEENKRLATNFITAYTKYYQSFTHVKSMACAFDQDFYFFWQQNILEESHIPYEMSPDPFGWSMFEIMWHTIDKLFDGYQDWHNTVSIVNGQSDMVMTAEHIDKYAVVLTYQAITRRITSWNVINPRSHRWYVRASNCDFAINIQHILCLYTEPYAFWGDKRERKAAQYVIYPITKNIFTEIANQAYHMLKNGIIELDPMKISRLSPSIWKVPQYVMLYYADKTEIYRCEPD